MTTPPVRTTDVFTPGTSSPTLSKALRQEQEQELDDYIEERGKFIFVHGATKVGKTTIVEGAVKKLDLSIWFNSQNLRQGPADLWSGLASALKQPVEEALSNDKSDKSKWNFIGSLGFLSNHAGGEHVVGSSRSQTFSIELSHKIPQVLELLAADGHKVALVLDDFHFIENEQTRADILQALKPVGNKGVSTIVITLPFRDDSRPITAANLSGRTEYLPMPLWSLDELKSIADTGFASLNVFATEDDTTLLAQNSFGSPQIMQDLCLQLCRKFNNVREKQSGITQLEMPANPADLYTRILDDTALRWLGRIGAGLKPRGVSRKTYELKDGPPVDGYLLILHTLRTLGPKPSTTISEFRAGVAKSLGIDIQKVPSLNLDEKLRNMSTLAAVDMRASLKEVDDEAAKLSPADIFSEKDIITVPQPVFEWDEKAAAKPINILDPLLSFTLYWHWDAVLKLVAEQQS
ncbi:ATP-binding protein (plasmid) [Arthrobacter agilis]|uniref:ATP-binding protein n=1 Tax=Arthrobacter agilis TaxID=37921 RepID=UPI002365A549|nr:ATP-binding protein [Arthrobacter agilis]WDF35287.1 ATP-binding protein [Arthrobacter agilis]